jgi:hypothetical protein
MSCARTRFAPSFSPKHAVPAQRPSGAVTPPSPSSTSPARCPPLHTLLVASPVSCSDNRFPPPACAQVAQHPWGHMYWGGWRAVDKYLHCPLERRGPSRQTIVQDASPASAHTHSSSAITVADINRACPCWHISTHPTTTECHIPHPQLANSLGKP